MTFISVLLFIIFLVLLVIPTSYSTSPTAYSKRCGPHKWEYKESGVENHTYMVCSTCGFLAGGGDDREENNNSV